MSSPTEDRGFLELAERLEDQRDEPWPMGSESDRLHYWRDKAIEVAKALRTQQESKSA
jgi:hypothetical protein